MGKKKYFHIVPNILGWITLVLLYFWSALSIGIFYKYISAYYLQEKILTLEILRGILQNHYAKEIVKIPKIWNIYICVCVFVCICVYIYMIILCQFAFAMGSPESWDAHLFLPLDIGGIHSDRVLCHQCFNSESFGLWLN